MIKMKTLAFMTILMLALTGCGKEEQEPLRVYSFSGENEQFAVSNGIIVLNGSEEIFSGGDLKAADESFIDITSYSTTFYTISGSEGNVILSNSVTDTTGGTVNVSGDWGQIAGDRRLRRVKIDDTNDLNDSLYFELSTKVRYGTENVYQLQMAFTYITKNNGN